MDDTARQVPNKDVLGFELPTPEEGLAEAKRWLGLPLDNNSLTGALRKMRFDVYSRTWRGQLITSILDSGRLLAQSFASRREAP